MPFDLWYSFPRHWESDCPKYSQSSRAVTILGKWVRWRRLLCIQEDVRPSNCTWEMVSECCHSCLRSAAKCVKELLHTRWAQSKACRRSSLSGRGTVGTALQLAKRCEASGWSPTESRILREVGGEECNAAIAQAWRRLHLLRLPTKYVTTETEHAHWVTHCKQMLSLSPNFAAFNDGDTCATRKASFAVQIWAAQENPDRAEITLLLT